MARLSTSTSVPPQVWQTFASKRLSPEAAESIRVMRLTNPRWQFHLVDDAKMDAFVKAHFHPFVHDAFVSIIPGVARADFWRYCVLYVLGGVYLDVDSRITRPLDAWIRPNDSAIVAQENWGWFRLRAAERRGAVVNRWPFAWAAAFTGMAQALYNCPSTEIKQHWSRRVRACAPPLIKLAHSQDGPTRLVSTQVARSHR